MDKMNEFIAALKEGEGYSWIANNGYTLSKDELCRIIMEYDYAIYSKTHVASDKQDVYTAIADELEEMYGDE